MLSAKAPNRQGLNYSIQVSDRASKGRTGRSVLSAVPQSECGQAHDLRRQMANESDNSVSYLMSLKQASEAAASSGDGKPPASPKAAVSGIPQRSQRYSGAEKRRSPRYKCEGSAEMHQEGTNQRTWATFTDISLHGCYVEATSTYPVGTTMDMKLEANGLKVNAKGTVRVNYPYLGMGIAFIDILEEDRAQLRELLRSISRPSVILGSGSTPVAPTLRRSESLPPINDAEAAIKAIVQYFDERQLLTREEFSRLLRKSQQP